MLPREKTTLVLSSIARWRVTSVTVDLLLLFVAVCRTTRRHPAIPAVVSSLYSICSRHVHVIACPPPNIVYPCCSSSPRKTFSFYFFSPLPARNYTVFRKKHPLVFSCITLRKSNQFERKFRTKNINAHRNSIKIIYILVKYSLLATM